jgi:valyl-tRNA synthetase
MTNAAGRYAGLDRFEARKRVLAALEESGELVKTEPYTVNISKCHRCQTVIEPLVSTQWFVRMKPLAKKAMDAVKSGRIRFVPDDREVVFFQWMENIRDWCISRQLWWGHRIPAWHCRNCGQITVARTAPLALSAPPPKSSRIPMFSTRGSVPAYGHFQHWAGLTKLRISRLSIPLPSS